MNSHKTHSLDGGKASSVRQQCFLPMPFHSDAKPSPTHRTTRCSNPRRSRVQPSILHGPQSQHCGPRADSRAQESSVPPYAGRIERPPIRVDIVQSKRETTTGKTTPQVRLQISSLGVYAKLRCAYKCMPDQRAAVYRAETKGTTPAWSAPGGWRLPHPIATKELSMSFHIRGK